MIPEDKRPVTSITVEYDVTKRRRGLAGAMPGKAFTGNRAIIIGFAAVTIVGASLFERQMLIIEYAAGLRS
jgi:hypothetical protein